MKFLLWMGACTGSSKIFCYAPTKLTSKPPPNALAILSKRPIDGLVDMFSTLEITA